MIEGGGGPAGSVQLGFYIHPEGGELCQLRSPWCPTPAVMPPKGRLSRGPAYHRRGGSLGKVTGPGGDRPVEAAARAPGASSAPGPLLVGMSVSP